MRTIKIQETDDTAKKYWEFSIILFPQEKVVSQQIVILTERQMHEKSASISEKLEKSGMAFNGKNESHHFGLAVRELPSPEELERMIAALQK